MDPGVQNPPNKPLSLSSENSKNTTSPPINALNSSLEKKKKPGVFSRTQEKHNLYARPLNKAIRGNMGGKKEHNFTIEYHKQDGEKVTRKIKPLSANAVQGYIKAWDHHRAGVRTYKLERINSMHKEASGCIANTFPAGALPNPFISGFLKESKKW